MPGSSSGEAFCYFGLARMRERLEAVLALLPDHRREEATRILDACRELSGLDLRNRLAALRESEAKALRRGMKLAPGIAPESLNPVLRRWLESRVGNGDGREDHQGAAGR